VRVVNRVESAWFKRLKLKYDQLLRNFAFYLKLRPFKTVHRLIMTGAPIQNRLAELWSLFDFVFPGEAVQVEPLKSKSKAPGTKRLKLKHDILHSSFDFEFNTRRYTRESSGLCPCSKRSLRCRFKWAVTPTHLNSR
jgi:hypothetical protein